MLKNYFVLAIRNLLKRKLYSFINIFGLAVGMAVCLIILKYVDVETSYDDFQLQADRTYRTTTTYYSNGEFKTRHILSGYAQGPALLDEVPEVETYVRTHPLYGGAVLSYQPSVGDAMAFFEEEVQFVDSTYFKVFTHNAISGDLNTALDQSSSVVITERIARKYFGDEPALGKTMKLSGGWADGDYMVTAVIEDVPQNAHFQFDFLLTMHNLLQNPQYQQDNGWGWNNFVTYVMLNPQANVQGMDEKLAAFTEKHERDNQPENEKFVLGLQPIKEIHLTPGLSHESSSTVSKGTIYFFILISVFILAIAWINYINLSTARAMERSREVGIKKAVGAHKGQLIYQFLFESVWINFLAVVIAVAMATALLPLLSEIVGKNLFLDFSDYRLWLILLGLFTVGSLISGAYPAFVLSSFNAIDVLKGRPERMVGGFSLRKVLVVFQFASSLMLIAGTFTVYRQIMFMRSKDKGLTMEQMLIVNGPSILDRSYGKERLITFKNQLKALPQIKQVTTSGAIPGGGYNWGTFIRKDGSEEKDRQNGNIVWVDPDFINTYGITVLSGRNFNPEIKSDMESVLVNEAALTAFNLGTPEEALNERLLLGSDTVNILGVLKNYHWNSLKLEHSPWLFKADTISRRAYSILLTGNDIPGTIEEVEAKFKETFPGNPFDYYFLDDFFNTQYADDQQFGKIFSLFAILAILIACLGLWGLAAYSTNQRLKEIGIRKVMGASVNSIMSLLSWQFVKLVLLASLVGLPIAWYGINAWLKDFAFRIDLNWDLFVVPVIILCGIALGTVSLQILRGAKSNPAKILRSE